MVSMANVVTVVNNIHRGTVSSSARRPPRRVSLCPDALAQIVGRQGAGDRISMRLGWRAVG